MTLRERLSAWLIPSSGRSTMPPLRTDVGEVVDDARLTEWARPEPAPLVPLLEQAAVMRPLILLIAIVPPLVAFQNRPLTQAGAEWSLRALDCYSADGLATFFDPAGPGSASAYRAQPPLVSWLTAAGMRVGGPERSGSRSAAVLACTMALIGAVSLLARRIGGDRLGLLAALIVALQTTTMEFAQQPLPDSVALLGVVVALWCWENHLAFSDRLFTVWLLGAMLALGWTTLAGGPLVFPTLAVMLLQAWLRSRSRDALDNEHGWRDVLLVAAAGLSLGGWWVLWMALRHGAGFWPAWLTLSPPEPVAAGSFVVALRQLAAAAGPWISLAAAGLWSIVASPGVDRVDPPVAVQRTPRVLAWWIVLAGLCWTSLMVAAPQLTGRLWTSLVVLPIWILAAHAIVVMVDRRLPFPAAALALGTAATEFLWHWSVFSSVSVSRGIAATLIAVGIAVLIGLIRWAGDHDLRRRAVLLGLLAFVCTGSVWLGLSRMHRASVEDRQLQALRIGLSRIPNVRSCVLINGDALPESRFGQARRRYLLRSLWPHLRPLEISERQLVALPESSKSGVDGTDVLIAWGSRRQIPAPDFTLLHSHDDGGFEVATYVRERRP